MNVTGLTVNLLSGDIYIADNLRVLPGRGSYQHDEVRECSEIGFDVDCQRVTLASPCDDQESIKRFNNLIGVDGRRERPL